MKAKQQSQLRKAVSCDGPKRRRANFKFGYRGEKRTRCFDVQVVLKHDICEQQLSQRGDIRVLAAQIAILEQSEGVTGAERFSSRISRILKLRHLEGEVFGVQIGRALHRDASNLVI